MENSRKRSRDLRLVTGNVEPLGYELRKRNSGEEDGGPGNGRFPIRFRDFVVDSGKCRNSPTKRAKVIGVEHGIKLKGRSTTVEVAGRINTNKPKKKQKPETDQNQQQYSDFRETDQNEQQHNEFRVSEPLPPQNLMESGSLEDLSLEEVGVGDIVWARSDRRKDSPAWPAKVIDPEQDAPESVLSVWVPGQFCVRFYGMKGSWDCAYAWVKKETIFAFLHFFEQFACGQGQKFLEMNYKLPKGDFQEAIAEALVAEYSPEFRVIQDQAKETTCSSCSEKLPASELKEYVKLKQLSTNSCKNGMLICENCRMLYEYNQYCGICMEVCRKPTLNRSWVQCYKCKIWVHADCGNVSNEQLQDLYKYSCPQCTEKQQTLGSAVNEKNNNPFTVPECINVVCNGKEADYVTNSHLILCACNGCEKGKPMSLSQWERHVGCKMKKWKQSVKVRGSNQYLIDWLNQAHEVGVCALGFFTTEGQTPIRGKERELRGWLLEPYEPIKEIWTAERCAICRGVEDWVHDKIIICNGCGIAVHRSCYGVSESLGDWFCTACKRSKTKVRPQCCLCPVMGGALKPTTIPEFWVHVTCACFTNEVTFVNDQTMEPVDGILKINPTLFRKSCVICNKKQGSCIQCSECETSYHAMCALIKGYHMEVSHWKNKRKAVCSYISYCACHKVPDPNVGLIIPQLESISISNPNEAQMMKTPIVIHSTDSSDHGYCSTSKDDNNLVKDGLLKIDEPHAARCAPYNPLRKKYGISAIIHRPRGYSQHFGEVIEGKLKQEAAPPQFFSSKERLSYCQKNENMRLCIGKSELHGFGLFAIKHIRRGDMVIEYRGEVIRNSVTDVREKRYNALGKHSTYFFAIDKETVIDATKKGNLARFINHSCTPNCFARILAVDGVENRIALFAKKDIEAGEEITFDYRLSKEGLTERCSCGAATCPKFM